MTRPAHRRRWWSSNASVRDIGGSGDWRHTKLGTAIFVAVPVVAASVTLATDDSLSWLTRVLFAVPAVLAVLGASVLAVRTFRSRARRVDGR